MKKLLTITTLMITVAALRADQTTMAPQTAGFQLSMTPDIAIHPKTTEIHGLSLGIWSENPQKSLTLGFVNGSTGESSGFSWAFIYNYAESYKGVEWALVNHTTKSFVGWQDSWVNYDEGYFKGLESGLVNVAQDTHGLQLGAINYTEKLHGLQIGLINVVTDNPWFSDFPDKLAKGFVIVNWSF